MFSLTNGKPIAKFINGKYSKNPNKKLLKLDIDKKINNIGSDVFFKESLVPVPNIMDRHITYIAGPSGSGKSTMVNNYVDILTKVFKNMPVILFSRKQEDPSLSNKNIMWFPINEQLLEDPVDITQDIGEEGALIIFDDINTIQDNKLRVAVSKIMNDILEVGRQYNIYCIITNHLINPNERKEARTILNEMHELICFPHSGSKYQIKYTLEKYFGIDKKNIERILNLPSRWVLISKSYPMYCLYDKGAFLLS